MNTKIRGFSSIEALLGMSLGVGIIGCTVLIMSSFAKAGSSEFVEHEGERYYEIPSQKALIQAIELNYKWVQLLQESTNRRVIQEPGTKSIELSQGEKITGRLSITQKEFNGSYLSKIELLVPSHETYSYCLCSRQEALVASITSQVKGSPVIGLQGEKIHLTLPNPMGNPNQSAKARFSYTFFNKDT